MNILSHVNRHAVLISGALLLCVVLSAYADDIEDANKLFKQGQRNEALDKVNDYLVIKPKDAQARFLKGLILTEQGKTSDAIKIFTALTEDYPDLPEPYNNLAVLYAGQGQYDKAKLLLERAISTHPSYATAHENLGDIYAKMASQAYDRALQLDHSNTATQTKLAMIQNLFAGGLRNNKDNPSLNTPISSKVEETTPAMAAENQPGHDQPVPAASATPAKSEIVTSSSKFFDKKEESKEALKTVTAWAAAWSAKKTDKYLSFYAEDFKTPSGETRATWENSRRERINKPKFIHIDIRNMTLQFTDNDHVTVKFHQSYRASHLKSSGKKTLQMVKSHDKWLIQEERSY